MDDSRKGVEVMANIRHAATVGHFSLYIQGLGADRNARPTLAPARDMTYDQFKSAGIGQAKLLQ